VKNMRPGAIHDITFAALVTLSSFALGACGTNQIHVDPKSVTDLRLELPKAAGEPSFCPGEPIKLEVVATLNDGTKCSNVDPATGCMGKGNALLDPVQIRVDGNAGAFLRKEDVLVWIPARDALATAEKGLSLRAWLEEVQNGQAIQSKAAEAQLRPEYHCMEENIFSIDKPLPLGQEGRHGPDLKVSATTFSTPYYPEAALIRVEYAGSHTHIIAPLGKKPIKIISKGQSGATGVPGRNGVNGTDGINGGGRADNRSIGANFLIQLLLFFI